MWFDEILTLPQAEVAVFFLALASASSSSDKPQVQFLHAFFFFGPSPQVAEVTLKPITYFSNNSKLLIFLFSQYNMYLLTEEFVKFLYSIYLIQVQYIIMYTIRPTKKLKKIDLSVTRDLAFWGRLHPTKHRHPPTPRHHPTCQMLTRSTPWLPPLAIYPLKEMSRQNLLWYN